MRQNINMKLSYQSYINEVYDAINKILKSHKKYGVNKNLGDTNLHLVNQMPFIHKSIKDSIPFRLPDNGLLFNEYNDSNKKRLNTFVQEIRLPFPICTLEFELTKPSKEIKNTPLLKIESYRYCIMLIENEDYISIYDFIDDGHSDGMAFVSADALRLDKKTFDFYDNEHAYGFGCGLFNREKVIIDFICALSCNNVEIVDSDIKPSAVKQQMRKQKGNIPLFVHKILSLNSKPMAGQQAKSKMGTHSSPSCHLRRGHIRRLPNKNVWVNACVVGDKSTGMVLKDYAVI